MDMDLDVYLAHYGTKRHSGRYPWGSGQDEHGRPRSASFLDEVNHLKKQGMSEKEIADGLGMTTSKLRALRSHYRAEQKQHNIDQAVKLRAKGMSPTEIGRAMNLNESTVRSLLAPSAADKIHIQKATADLLRSKVDEHGMVEVGSGTEYQLKISETKLKNALSVLKEEGYVVHNVQYPQLGMGAGMMTTARVLAKPGTTYGDVKNNIQGIHYMNETSEDGGRSYIGIKDPLKLDPKRVKVRYAEEGGTEADGVLYVRPGKSDLSLGGKNYAQVRVAVGDTHYMKGVAIYKDDLPSGVDILFNTNKKLGTPMMGPKDNSVLKPIKNDPVNPFGAVIKRQITDKNDKVTSVMNVVNEEGDWDKWSRNLPSQFLSKQNPSLAKTQLDVTYERHRQDLDDILSLTNPSVRKKLLDGYADGADASAVHLQAASMKRQSTHVILPVESMKPTEIYAPNFKNGERVVLVRFPHGGIFEIPELTVNNNHPGAKKLLGSATDAVGIHSKVAEKLSGADFDGDTVLVIPNNRKNIKSMPALEGLKGFDAKAQYPKYDGMHVMTSRETGLEMGKISNLITDMTIHGASHDELARAVRHSMVVIDAEKHELDYKKSEVDNSISLLKKKYQGGANRGASTIISRASSEAKVLDRSPRRAAEGGPIDKYTGEKVYSYSGKTNAQGKPIFMKAKSTKMMETSDARTLLSDTPTPMEHLYADHANRMKALANEARRNSVNTEGLKRSPSAAKAYATEVAELKAALDDVKKNRPLERQAQLLANGVVAAMKADNPNLTKEEVKKIGYQALDEMRRRTGASKHQIEFTPKQWEAIQAGAIAPSTLSSILDYTDLEVVRKMAMPKKKPTMTATQTARARAMAANGYTQADIAEQLGVSIGTLKGALGGGS